MCYNRYKAGSSHVVLAEGRYHVSEGTLVVTTHLGIPVSAPSTQSQLLVSNTFISVFQAHCGVARKRIMMTLVNVSQVHNLTIQSTPHLNVLMNEKNILRFKSRNQVKFKRNILLKLLMRLQEGMRIWPSFFISLSTDATEVSSKQELYQMSYPLFFLLFFELIILRKGLFLQKHLSQLSFIFGKCHIFSLSLALIQA